MKLKDLVNLILNTAKTQPCVNTALEGDVYQLNERKDVKYGAFVLTLGDVVKSEDWRTCNFTMFYVDRLTEDESNRLDVQTTALDCLGNIATTLENFDLELQSVSYHPFTNRFEGECAGAYAELAIAISNEECADIYDIITPEPYDPFNPYVILEDYAKKSWVNNNFDTSEEVDDKIKEAIIAQSGVTPEIVDDKIAEALENYPDSAQTQEMIDYSIENQHLKTINGNSIKGEGNIQIGGDRYFDNLQKITDYYWRADYTFLDYDYARAYFRERTPDFNVGACTSVRKGNLFGRNLDWYYSHQCDFLVKTKDTLGNAGGMSVLTEQFVESNKRDDAYRILPFYLQDGINRSGVYANINVVMQEESKGVTTGSTPLIEKREEICSIMLVRYILDNFNNATDAVEYIRDFVSVYTPQALRDLGMESHWMIGDKENTYVLEFVNNQAVIIEKNVLANFYWDGVVTNRDNSLYSCYDVQHTPTTENHLTPYSCGVERYNLVNRYYDAEGTMRQLMNMLLYTNTYTKPEGADYWYSEAVGGDLTIDSKPADFAQTILRLKRAYAERTRENPVTWQTTHSCVYDLATLSVNVIVQENTANEFNFKLIENNEFVTSLYVRDIWVGNLASYSEIYPKSETTLYIITDN